MKNATHLRSAVCALLFGALSAVPMQAQVTPDLPTQEEAPARTAVLAQASDAFHAPVQSEDGAFTWTYGPYAYDPSGNIVTIGSSYGSQPFTYDLQGRLVDSTVTGPDGATRQQYTYDVYGNMIAKNTDGTSQTLATSTATNRLTALNPQYDEAGNLTQWQAPGTSVVYHYDYDNFNMLREENVNDAVGNAHRIIHLYTADNERVWTYDAGPNQSHWTLRGLDEKVERDFYDNGSGTWSVFRDYLYRDGALLAAVKSSGVEHFSLDHLGTPRLVTDADHVQAGFHTYRPFGEEWSTAGRQDGDPMHFTGHERDFDPAGMMSADIDDMHARYYAGLTGRFFSPDPIVGVMDDPQIWNRYSYVHNSPLMVTDPTGMVGVDENGGKYNKPTPGDGGGPLIITAPALPTKIIIFGMSAIGYSMYRASQEGQYAFMMLSGAANAYGSDKIGGVGRMHVEDACYEWGQLGGDAVAFVEGGVNFFTFVTADVGTLAGDAVPAGELATVPAEMVITEEAVRAGVQVKISGQNLMSGIKKKKPGSLGERKGRDALRVENERARDAMRAHGVDPDSDLGQWVHRELQYYREDVDTSWAGIKELVRIILSSR